MVNVSQRLGLGTFRVQLFLGPCLTVGQTGQRWQHQGQRTGTQQL